MSIFGENTSIIQQSDFRLLLLATIPSVLGPALVSPILDSLIGPFGSSEATIGLMISAYTAPGILLVAVSGALADRYGRKIILITSLILFGVAGTAISLTSNFQIVLLLRFIQGMGAAGINPVIITSIGDMYSGSEEETGQGLRFMVSGFSGGFFPVVASVLVIVAWQYPFILYSIALPIAGGVYLWFDEPTNLESSNSIDGRSPMSYGQRIFTLIKHRKVVAMVLARTLMSVVFIGFITYNSLIVIRLLGGSSVTAGVFIAILYSSFAISASQAGRITSLFESRLYLLITANLGVSLSFILVLFAPGILVASFGILGLGVWFGVIGALYRSIITDLAPEALRAGLVGFAEASGKIADTLVPLVIGMIIYIVSRWVGFEAALQISGTLVGLMAGLGGILCLIITKVSPEVPHSF